MEWMQNSGQLTDAVKADMESKTNNLKDQLKQSIDRLYQVKKDSNSLISTLPISVTKNPLYNRLSQRRENLKCNLSVLEQKFKYYESQG